MSTRSRRLVSQTSGIALAAIVVTAMSVHNHRVIAAVQTAGQATQPAIVAAGSDTDQNGQVARVRQIAYGTITPKMYHHYP